MSDPVVVTGIGTAIAGVGGVGDLLGPDPVRGDDDPAERITGRGHRYKDRATRLGLVAGEAALRDAGLPSDRAIPPQLSTGVVVSSNLGNVDTVCDTVRTIADETYLATSPMLLPNTASNVIASWLAITYGLRGVNLTFCNGPTSGLDAVHWARTMIRSGRVERMLVVGVEPVTEPVRRLAAADRGDAVGPGPSGSALLFDGAVGLVVEDARVAAARQARVLATVDRYARAGSHDEATRAVCPPDARLGLWCPPEQPDGLPHNPGTLPSAVLAAARLDLTAVLGRSSGALGVLQCAAGAAWLADGTPGSVLATAGVGAPTTAPGRFDDATSALVLTAGAFR
ncbi:beta-ketoacyl synthase N-terminal-like domain-containing protein [Micromonospora sp. WMMA1947]|uniref:beta-ketoacyl synthase N-terminal-like domain-containing protein n=1 Tax=Micromonospora sp. WMMA1947 TaxID=3015163 RepID=UPI00248A9AC4|nr:beta-ketoacyl synthase N-terminal-like domain-containing protein [Micromonospora sp. WMMA1947]WBC07488.1 beta-ketoacyl synthase N-terminal-like domain-containing protein [Micromonospora sp. WMMA1947]